MTLKRVAFFYIALGVLLTACTPDPPKPVQPTVSSKDELLLYLDTLEQRYETACEAMGLANWNSYSKEAPYNLDSAKAGLAGIFLDSSARTIIEEWRGKANSLADKPLSRRLELWYRCFIGGAIYADPEIAALENTLQQQITNFAFKHKGSATTRAQVSNGLRQERRQADRQSLWRVTSQLSAVAAADLQKLITLRNERARSFGFPNYYALSLHLQAIDEEWLLKTLALLEERTHDAFERFIASSKAKLRIKEIGPWDFDFALREGASLPNKYFPPDSVFSILHRFERGIGFEVDSLPIKEVVLDIPYGGLSLAIRIPSDSRFLVNPTRGKGFYSTAFHEYGHSLKAVHTRASYPILKGYEWVPGAQCAAYEEGVADLHGEFTDDSLWLATFTKTRSREIDKYMETRGIPALYRLRRLLKDFAIEYELYKNPTQDAAALERMMFRKYLLVNLDSTEAHQYAASIWYTSYPCYYQNYILAGMIATQLHEALNDKFAHRKSLDSAVAPWMIDHLYSSGEALEWTERIRNATGKSLETGAFLRKLRVDSVRTITARED